MKLRDDEINQRDLTTYNKIQNGSSPKTKEKKLPSPVSQINFPLISFHFLLSPFDKTL